MAKKGLSLSDKLFGLAIAILLLIASLQILPDLDSKKPTDEQATVEHKTNVVAGKTVNVEIVKCKACSKTISYIEYDKKGKPVGGFVRASHECKKWGGMLALNGLRRLLALAILGKSSG